MNGEAAAASHENGLIGRFLGDRRDALRKRFMLKEAEMPPVSIAAFSDPNDLLSYSLCKSDMDRLKGVEVADIWVRNAINFVVYANPMSAHQDYWKNKEVIKLLVGDGEDGEQMCGARTNGSSQGAE